MNPLSPDQVHRLLDGTAPGGTLYLIGVGGCGMSGLAHLFLDLGYRVAGSDLVANEEIQQLQKRGAQICLGHASEQLRASKPLLVIYSSAIRLSNPELLLAQELKIPIVRRGVVLAALLRRQRGICVAGMHGKTTTSALLAFAFDQLQQKPSYAIGALIPQLKPHARFTPVSRLSPLASHPFFIVEADESDGTLREFKPEHSIILNVDEEHLDYYADLDTICREFQQFAGQTSGRLIYCADDTRLPQLCRQRADAISYGFAASAQYRITDVTALPHGISGSRFEVWHNGARLSEFTIDLVGDQNVSNATAVIALLHQLEFAPFAIAQAICAFRGASRRQQELYRDDRFRVFDDYGHHPNEVRATLHALRSLKPSRLLVAFQPHRFTRTRHLLDEFATCFKGVDKLWLTEIYAASEPSISGISGETLASAVRSQGEPVEFVASLEALHSAVRTAIQPGDLILFLGAGDITKVAHGLAEDLRKDWSQRKALLRAKLASRLSSDSIVRCDEALAKRTTLRVGGSADLYVEPASESDLAMLLRFCGKEQLPFMVLGRGSNLLIQDGGIRGVVICLARPEFSRIEVKGEELHCGAGAKLKDVAQTAKRHGLAGLEFLEGIPGNVGGGLRMNAGAMGDSMFRVVHAVRMMDFSGAVHERKADAVPAEYRNCPVFKTHIALGAILKGQPAARETIAEKMTACSQKRWNSQPAAPSAGCIFKNPSTVPAGRLIEELGLKGLRVGGAVISTVHGNFIVNEGNATALDVLNLIEIVKQRAKAMRGIELETEVEIVGEGPDRAEHIQ